MHARYIDLHISLFCVDIPDEDCALGRSQSHKYLTYHVPKFYRTWQVTRFFAQKWMPLQVREFLQCRYLIDAPLAFVRCGESLSWWDTCVKTVVENTEILNFCWWSGSRAGYCMTNFYIIYFPKIQNRVYRSINSANNFIFIITEYYFRWPMAITIPLSHEETITKVIYWEIFYTFGLPAEILSDRRSHFANKPFKAFAKL